MVKTVYSRWGVDVFEGDCLDALRSMPDASVHAVVTDPPAGIRFMNRAWDSDMGGRHSWVSWLSERMAEAHRVLKPGGHAVVWSLPRTSHWTAWALEDAGFEIRDCLVHLFGAGMPKSLDVSKAIDRARDDGQFAEHVGQWLGVQRRSAGLSHAQLCELGGWHGQTNHGGASVNWEKGHNVPTWEQWGRLRELLGFGDAMDAEVWRLNGRKGTPGEAWGQREVIGQRTTGIGAGRGSVPYMADSDNRDLTAPATDAARQWDGWGTSLKPSQEMWWLCRKPLSGTVAQTALEHGTGALNIGACRVQGPGAEAGRTRHGGGANSTYAQDAWTVANQATMGGGPMPAGRWPSNVVFSHLPALDLVSGEVVGDACAEGCVAGCAVRELDAQSGVLTSGANPVRRSSDKFRDSYGSFTGQTECTPHRGADQGGASRFFHCFRWEAKAPTAERPRVNGKAHATVKPLALMRFLVRLVTPPGGTVLDCFAGTGTTGQACRAEGFQAILIENDPESIPLIKARLDAQPKTEAAAATEPADEGPMDLFGLLDGEAS